MFRIKYHNAAPRRVKKIVESPVTYYVNNHAIPSNIRKPLGVEIYILSMILWLKRKQKNHFQNNKGHQQPSNVNIRSGFGL